MRKYLFLLIVFVVAIAGCGEEAEVRKDSGYAEVISAAAQKLRGTYRDYVITTSLDAPDGQGEYIEVVHDGAVYTEYSVDDDENLGTIGYGTEASITYSLTDWTTKDGEYYAFDGELVYRFPDSYGRSYVSGRDALYVERLLAGALSIEPYESLTLNLGYGERQYDAYLIKVKSETVKEVLGAGSWGMYKSILDEEKDSNIGRLCQYYIEDLDMNLTFSDANVVVGIDNNGILMFMSLEVGGLGTRLYYTKAVVDVENLNVRDEPDFTNAAPISASMQELADFVAGYDSYDEAVKALDGWSSIEQTEEYDDETTGYGEIVTDSEDDTVESDEGTEESIEEEVSVDEG